LAESFFYSHLESAVELTQKYALLVGQPVKDRELKVALQDTRETLHSMSDVLERDLKKVLSTDVEQLRMELDYARLTVDQHNNQKLLEQYPTDSEGDVEHDRKSLESK
jgi:5-bromo-4-chloroindolyl phosphate hydrolysis protein